MRIEGKFTKPSAVYHPNLADFIPGKIYQAIVSKYKHAPTERQVQLESVVLNDVLQQDQWRTVDHWFWKRPAHINVLESNSFVRLLHHFVKEGGDLRFNALLDSRVAKGAYGKGRSNHH